MIGAFAMLGVADAFLPAYTDRLGFLTFGGESLRWLGFWLFAIGGLLRLAPVFVLGRRFSGLVAIQPDHELVTGGIYGHVAHPSYLGLLINTLGWALAFRSGVGAAIAAAMLIVVLARHQGRGAAIERNVRGRLQRLSRARLAAFPIPLLERLSF